MAKKIAYLKLRVVLKRHIRMILGTQARQLNVSAGMQPASGHCQAYAPDCRITPPVPLTEVLEPPNGDTTQLSAPFPSTLLHTVGMQAQGDGSKGGNKENALASVYMRSIPFVLHSNNAAGETTMWVGESKVMRQGSVVMSPTTSSMRFDSLFAHFSGRGPA